MTNNLLSTLSGVPSIPDASIFMASMATKYGGLGIQNPRATAIPSFVVSIKRCLGYANNGVWVGQNNPTVQLPSSILSLWSNPVSSTSKTLQLFYKYLPSIERICVSNQVNNRRDFFIDRSSINTCRERIKEEVGIKTRDYIQYQWNRLKQRSSLANFTDILHPNLAQGLLDLPRINEKNRIDNQTFTIMLKRKLRIPLYHSDTNLICPKCKNPFDIFGDHLFKCAPCKKDKMHDNWRDDSEKFIMKELLPLVKLIDKPSEVENEQPGLIFNLSNSQIKPFDLSFPVNKNTGESYFRSPLRRIGFDITMSQAAEALSDRELSQPDLTSAQLNGIALQLLDCEKGKFNRDNGGTDPKTHVTLSGDEIIGDLITRNQALLPWSISPYGKFGGIAARFWYGETAINLKSVLTKRHAKSAASLAVSNKVPSGVLERANKIWQHKHPGDFFGRSYKSQTPFIYASQVFGRLTCKHNGQHIIKSMSTIGNPIPAANEEMDRDDDGNMVDSTITSYEGNINALNSVNIHR